MNRILTYLIILQKVREDVDMLLCDSSENNIVALNEYEMDMLDLPKY